MRSNVRAKLTHLIRSTRNFFSHSVILKASIHRRTQIARSVILEVFLDATTTPTDEAIKNVDLTYQVSCLAVILKRCLLCLSLRTESMNLFLPVKQSCWSTLRHSDI